MPDIHLKYGGSTMARTIHCQAWTSLSANIQPSTARNAAADHGSCLHECMEQIVVGDKAPTDYLDVHFLQWDHTVSAEDVGLLQTALEAFNQVADHYEQTEVSVEEFVQLTDIIGGSADVITCGPTHTLVVDWKFGYNEVAAHKSWQAATYALSAMNTPRLEDMFTGRKVVAVIIQPKVSDTALTYEYTDGELGDMLTAMVAAVHEAENGRPEPKPNDYCMYCPAAPTCPAKLVQATAAVNLPKDVSLDLETALGLAQQLEPWIRDVKKFAHEMLEQGADVPGWKLVDKRATRQWSDLPTVTKKLKNSKKFRQEDYADIKIKSAPQIEKVCKAKGVDFHKEFDSMVISRSSGTTLAPESDKREAVKAQLNQGEVQKALGNI